VNGKSVGEEIPGGQFYTIRRQWKPGDRVQLDMPMTWRFVKGRKAQSGRVAVMRGPMVFCLNRARNEQTKDIDLGEVTVLPSTIEGPIPDDSVRPGGMACRIKAWSPGQWYPHTKPELSLVLTEYADPGGEQTYFKVANPHGEGLVDDELTGIDLDKAE
jgi:hypothetical protein